MDGAQPYENMPIGAIKRLQQTELQIDLTQGLSSGYHTLNKPHPGHSLAETDYWENECMPMVPLEVFITLRLPKAGCLYIKVTQKPLNINDIYNT